mgnify:CR=1 FL=1
MYEHYMDNAATTRVMKEAREAAVACMEECYGNPSSLHGAGMDAEAQLTQARRRIAAVLKVSPAEIYFTSGATESNNLVLFGTAKGRAKRGKTIITTEIEHASVAHPIKALEQEGFRIRRVSPREDGRYYAEDFARAVDGDTILVSFMLVNNETGTILPAEEIARACKRKKLDLLVHVDGAQGFCKMPISLRRSDIDALTFSGHKIYAPKGVGGLFLKRNVKLLPLLYGGEHERGLRAGTEAVPLIAALGVAAEKTHAQMAENLHKYSRMKTLLVKGLAQFDEVALNSPEEGAPYIVNFSIRGMRSEIMLHFLESRGFYVSSGSACSKGAKTHVLSALGLPEWRKDCAVRVSFGHENRLSEIPLLLEALKDGISDLFKSF